MAEWQKMTGSGGAGVLLTLISLWFFGKSSDSYRADFAEKRLGVLQVSLDEESKKRKETEIGWEKAKEKEVQLEVREKWTKEKEASLEARKQEAQKVLDEVKTIRGEAEKLRGEIQETCGLIRKFGPNWQEAKKQWDKEREELLNEIKKLKGGKL